MSKIQQYSVNQYTNFKAQEESLEPQNEYYILTNSILTKSANNKIYYIYKLGYNCEPSGIAYPIYIKFENQEIKMYPDNNGIIEIQNETFKDTSNQDKKTESFELEIKITEVKVPVGINFVLDYAFAKE